MCQNKKWFKVEIWDWEIDKDAPITQFYFKAENEKELQDQFETMPEYQGENISIYVI